MEAYIIDKSLCKNCTHRVSRVISTEGLHLEYEDGCRVEDTVDSFLTESCAVLSFDIDHIVLSCNKFNESKPSSGLFTHLDIR